MTRRRTSAPKPAPRGFSYMSFLPPPGPRGRQRHFDEFRSGRFQEGSALAPELFDLRGHAVEAIFPGDADLHALHGFADRSLVVRHTTINRGGVLRVVAR